MLPHGNFVRLCIVMTLCVARSKRSTNLQAFDGTPDGDSESNGKSTLSKVGGVLATGAKNTVSGIGNFGKSAASRITTSRKGKEEAEESNQLLSQKIGGGVGRFLKGTAKRTKRAAATVSAGAKGFVKGASDHNSKTGRDENGEFHYDMESNEVDTRGNEHGEGDGNGMAKERKRKHRNKKGRKSHE